MSKDNNLEISDEQLIAGCTKGVVKFQEMLYRRFFSFAMSICVRYAPNQSDAMTIVNDSFLKVFDSMASFNPERSFKSWFARIVVNTAIDGYRKTHRQLEVLQSDDTPDMARLDTDSINRLAADDILTLFDGLPDIYRLTFNLYEIEGYSHDEIADMLGTTPATSRANLSRAKHKLRVLYSKHFNEARRHYEAI